MVSGTPSDLPRVSSQPKPRVGRKHCGAEESDGKLLGSVDPNQNDTTTTGLIVNIGMIGAPLDRRPTSTAGKLAESIRDSILWTRLFLFRCRLEFALFCFDHLRNDLMQRDANVPLGIVASELGKVADVTDMIAFAIVITQREIDLVSADLFDHRDPFQHAGRVVAATADVVDLAGTWVFRERLERFDDVAAFDLVANLFALVAKNRVGLTGHGNVNEIAQEPVQLHTAVTGTGQASAAKDTRLESKVFAVFLSQDVGRRFRRTEQRMHRLVDSARFVDSVKVLVRAYSQRVSSSFERQFVRGVAVHFVGAHVTEHGVGSVLPSGFEQIQRSVGVDFEIQETESRRPCRAKAGRRSGSSDRVFRS